jgi:D-alanine-D-alanine ligase
LKDGAGTFSQGECFKHEDLKWATGDELLMATPVTDPKLAARLKHEAAQFFVALGGASFGRCDVRVSEDGVPHMLEINVNCGLYYPKEAFGSADHILSWEPAGHRGFTRNLIEAALARHARATARARPKKKARARPRSVENRAPNRAPY